MPPDDDHFQIAQDTVDTNEHLTTDSSSAGGTDPIFDSCPDDDLKNEPGICGCGIADDDRDFDGTPDCKDECPLDSNKTGPGLCGCGVTDSPGCGGTKEQDWVTLEAGEFWMGSDLDDSEKPVHKVTIASFEMTRTEVTVEQYRACVSDDACPEPANWNDNCYWNQSDHENFPVNCVTWNHAVAYCTWIGGRLPTEAEWEYAARSQGQVRTYPWGNEAATCDFAVMNKGGNGCGTGLTLEVCSKKAGNTDQGLCDMAGNVWEWVQDGYHSTYDGAPADGSVWENGSLKIVRGGGFLSGADNLRSTFRNLYFDLTYQNLFLGIRCVREASF